MEMLKSVVSAPAGIVAVTLPSADVTVPPRAPIVAAPVPPSLSGALSSSELLHAAAMQNRTRTEGLGFSMRVR
jgi:hypothetical protein